MPIPVSCPSCHASGQAPDEALGQQITCPVCGTAFVLNKPQAPAPIQPPDPLGVWVGSGRVRNVPRVVTPSSAVVALPEEFEVPQAEPAPEPPKVESVPGDNFATEPPLPPSSSSPPPVPDAPMPAEWVKAEKDRFDSYVAEGLASLERARRENAEAESRHEAACVTRSIELSRQTTLLAMRGQDIDRREGNLRIATDALAVREEELNTWQIRLVEREAAMAAQESRVATLEEEAAALGKLIAELRPAVENLELRKSEAESLRTEFAAKQSALDRRLIVVGRSELAIQKRLAELDEYEQVLRAELEEREADLERQRATLMEEVRTMRERSVNTPTPMPRAGLPPASPSSVSQEEEHEE
jgi:hypothetical protein